MCACVCVRAPVCCCVWLPSWDYSTVIGLYFDKKPKTLILTSSDKHLGDTKDDVEIIMVVYTHDDVEIITMGGK